MRLIAIDTATDDTVVAAGHGSSVIYSFAEGPDEGGRPVHSQVLMTAIEAAAGALGGFSELDRIAVGLGPGTYTGIRIGIATARGLALSTGCPCLGFSTLDALAAGLNRSLPHEAGLRLAAIDAKRGEIFGALYEPDGSRLWKPFVCSPDELTARLVELGRSVTAGGSGAIRFREKLTQAGVQVPGPDAEIHRLSAESVCELGITASSEPLEPVYLRAPDAKLWTQLEAT